MVKQIARKQRVAMLFFLLSIFMAVTTCGSLESTTKSQKAPDYSYYETRYKLIQKIVTKYKRPFTMLEIGAQQGYYSFKAAAAYNCVCVMIDGNNPDYWLEGADLLTRCKEHKELTNIILLKKTVSIEDLQCLSECEHFDVVLALNVIHKFGTRWQEAMNALLAMGSALIIEIPHQDAGLSAELTVVRKKIQEFLASKRALMLGHAPVQQSSFAQAHIPQESALYLIQNGTKYLQRKTWLTPKFEQKTHAVISSFKKKFLSKKMGWPESFYHKSSWVPGINLLTFKMLQGVYPVKKTIKKAMKAIADKSHDDWIINNMIIQGQHIKLIDYDDPNRKDAPQSIRRFCFEAYQEHCKLIDLDDPEKINHFFWQRLIRVPIALHEKQQFLARLVKAHDLVFEIGQQEIQDKKLYEHTRLTVIADKELNLEELIAQCGLPQFCRINTLPVNPIVETLSSRIPTLAVKFSCRSIQDAKKAIMHLHGLGYKSFNFSARQIPYFVLDPWVSAQAIGKKIAAFAEKDHDEQNFEGFFYATNAFMRQS